MSRAIFSGVFSNKSCASGGPWKFFCRFRLVHLEVYRKSMAWRINESLRRVDSAPQLVQFLSLLTLADAPHSLVYCDCRSQVTFPSYCLLPGVSSTLHQQFRDFAVQLQTEPKQPSSLG